MIQCFTAALARRVTAARRIAAAAGLLIAMALAAPAVPAADLPENTVVGNWEGTLDAGGTRLRLVFRVVRTIQGTLSATLDSRD